ncbi:MAG TPA: MSMEG_4193 family putative phosphomutase [Acidimicrobiales bacterium]|nr:MSMEG_4193 family putative phosphomutase [Acidimicrobiales bacterium]
MATPTIAAPRSRPKSPPGTLVLFVRHGSTPTTGKVLPGRAAGLHLAEQGRVEAVAVAERLAAWVDGARPRRRRQSSPSITAVYASPLERTRETASPIAERLGLKVTLEPGLLECDFGEWTGAELKALYKLPEWSSVQRYPSGFRFPGGESFASMRARIADTVNDLCRRHPGETVVAVSHADPIKAAVSDALGTHLDLFQRIVVSPCSVTAISYQHVGPVVLTVNSTGSLSDLKPS